MKRKLIGQILAIGCVLLSCTAFAQTGYSRNNLTFSIGLFQQVRYQYDLAMHGYESQADELWNGSPFCRKVRWDVVKVRNTGPLAFGYLRRISKKVAIGGNFNAGYYKHIYDYGYQSLTHLGIAVDGRYYYYARNKWELYGAASIGVRYQNLYSAMPDVIGWYHIKTFSPVYQVSPLCISFGKKVKGFAECGLGYKGYANLGMQLGF